MNVIQLNRIKLNSISLNALGTCEGKAGVKVLWEEVTISSEGKTDTLLIRDMKPNSISALKAYGYCRRNSVRNAIVNNLNYMRFSNDGLPKGYARLEGITFNADTYYVIDGFRLKGSDTLRISFTANKACNLVGCYTTADADDNYDIYLSTTANSKYLRYNGGAYLSTVVVGERYDVVVTPTGCTGFASESKWTKKSFTASVDMLVGSTSVSATSSKFDGVIHGDVIVDGRLHLVPCERLSDGVVGYYDSVGNKFYEPTVGAGEAMEYDGSKVAQNGYGWDDADGFETILVYSEDGTKEYSNIVRNIPLFGIGDDSDSWELVSGNVTRKIGYYIFTGDETFSTSTAYGSATLLNAASTKWGADRTKAVVCSHFNGLEAVSSGTKDEGTCFFNASGHFYFRTSMSKDDFQLWLKRQYASASPVVVAYVMATEDNEVVSPIQPYNGKGNNYVERSCSSGIVLTYEVTCKVAPQDEKKMITFNLEGTEYQAVEGMIWDEFCQSEYNIHQFWSNGPDGFIFIRTEKDALGWFYTDYYVQDGETGSLVYGRDTIVAGRVYWEQAY